MKKKISFELSCNFLKINFDEKDDSDTATIPLDIFFKDGKLVTNIEYDIDLVLDDVNITKLTITKMGESNL